MANKNSKKKRTQNRAKNVNSSSISTVKSDVKVNASSKVENIANKPEPKKSDVKEAKTGTSEERVAVKPSNIKSPTKPNVKEEKTDTSNKRVTVKPSNIKRPAKAESKKTNVKEAKTNTSNERVTVKPSNRKNPTKLERKVADSKEKVVEQPKKKEKVGLIKFLKNKHENDVKKLISDSNFKGDIGKFGSDTSTWKKVLWVLKWIVLLPFRVIYYLFASFRMIFNILITCSIVVLIAVIILSARFMPMLEEAREQAYYKLSNMSENDFILNEDTVVLDKNGKKIGEIDAGRFQYVDIKDISQDITNGYIATEDKRFTLHAGVDFKSLSRAAFALVKNSGEITQGGSTITQQVIKNNLLTQDKTYSRKLIEVLLAPCIEKEYDKSKIMEFYCNSNYFGNQCYGVEAACQYYFNKSAKDVSLSEAAMIAGMSNSPNNYNPIDNYDLAIKRRNFVLGEMLSEGYIDQKQYDKAIAKEIKVAKDTSDSASSENYLTSYALYCTALQLMEQDGFKFEYTFETEDDYSKYKKRYEEAYSAKARQIRAGGYTIKTSLDTKLQRKLQDSIKSGLSGYVEKDKKTGKFKLQGAAVCVDNQTGYVVAIVGGRSSKDELNRGFLSVRQPGSTIKPLLDYAPAIENCGLNGSSIVTDKSVTVNGYTPKNYGGGTRGNVTVREALGRSLNTVAFQLYQQVGSSTAMKYLANMHFSSLSSVDNTALSLSLGGFTNGVKVVDMAKGYATIAMNGKYAKRTCITELKYKEDVVYKESEQLSDDCEEVFTEDTAFIMQDMMQGVFNEGYGTAHSAYNKEQVYAGKTGTTSDNRDAWFCGYSKYYTTAVWMGYDTPRTMYGVTGGSYPLSIWKNFMNSIHKNLDKVDFTPPVTIKMKRVSGGKLTGDSIKFKIPAEQKSIKDFTYYIRKGGCDWYSTLNREKARTYQNEQALKRAIRDCEEEVAEFELYKINNVESALGLDDAYDRVMATIETIPDVYKQRGFRTRVKKKYDLMNAVIDKVWTKAITEYQEKEQEKRNKQMQIDADEAETQGKATLRSNRIDAVEWYIDKLNGRHYYNKLTKRLIKDAEAKLSRCEGYSVYEDLSERLNSVITYCKGLPKAPESNDIPSNSSDYETDTDRNNKYPDDTQATEPPKTTVAPSNNGTNEDQSITEVQ